jgi:hypothetical protein
MGTLRVQKSTKLSHPADPDHCRATAISVMDMPSWPGSPGRCKLRAALLRGRRLRVEARCRPMARPSLRHVHAGPDKRT